jgi:integrase
MLAQKLEDYRRNQFPDFHPALFDNLMDDFLAELEKEGKLDWKKKVEGFRRNHLDAWFGGIKAKDITTTKINDFVRHKLNDGLAPGTINRLLSALIRMFRLAAQHTPPKIHQVPHIAKLTEKNVRQGFFGRKQFQALLSQFTGRSAHVRPVVEFAYFTGWRRQRIFDLTWEQIDMNQGLIMPDLNQPASKQVGLVSFKAFPELQILIRRQHKVKVPGCPYVFHNKGRKIVDIKTAWNNACKRANLEGMLLHDLRRTAARNMIRAGVPQAVAKKVTGHKTDTMFTRYNIVDEKDLVEAGEKMGVYLGNGASSGARREKKKKKGNQQNG